MSHEYLFYVNDDVSRVSAMAPAMEARGAKIAINANHVLRILREETDPGEHVTVRYSGGLVESCLFNLANRLLQPSVETLPYVVDHVIVDMATSVAFAEQIGSQYTVSERKRAFLNMFGGAQYCDPRLEVLPENT